jgi:hypothetical protein
VRTAHQGHLIFLQRFEQETDGLKWVSIQASHILFDIGDLAKIEKSEHKGIENREHMRSRAFANLTRILLQRDISTVMETIFNGTITNDKFCLSR